MKTLARYVLFDFLKVLLLALAGMTLFMLLIGVTTQAVREGLSMGPVIQMMPFIVPESMRFSIPAASLLAACVVFGRLAGDNELVAVKSLGISPWTVLAPVYVVAFLISVGAVWVNDLAVSWGRPGISRVVMNSIEQIAYAVLRTHKSYARDGFSITVRDVVDKRLIMPVIRFRHGEAGSDEFTITAREATLRRSDDDASLCLSLVDATVEGPHGMGGALTGENEYVISLQRPASSESPSDFPLYEIPRQRAALHRQIDHLAFTMSAGAAFAMICGELNELQSAEWDERTEELARLRYRRSRFVTEPWRRWANSFSCLFFVIVGAPLALRLRHSDFITTFFAAFMPILLVYYPLMAYGVDRAKAGALPQYAVWLGNLACLIWGLILLRKVFRY
jgi:lipopolysaccharide export system permease protein